MGAWGIKAMESDEGLDILYELQDFSKNNPKILLSEVFDYYVLQEVMSKPGGRQTVDDFTEDSAIMGLAEVIIEYNQNGKWIYTEFDGDDEEKEVVVSEIAYTKNDLDFIINHLKDILNPDSEHELYELWEETDSFGEWKDHMNFLISELIKFKVKI